MAAWFFAGGFGMLLIAVLGLAAIFVGASALAGAPTAGKLRFLRATPGLLGALAAMGSGMNLWVVNRHISQNGDDLRVAFVGMFEAVQPITLAGVLAAIAITLRMFAESRAKA